MSLFSSPHKNFVIIWLFMGCHLGSEIAVFTELRINSHKHITRWQHQYITVGYRRNVCNIKVLIILTESAKRFHQEPFNIHMNTINTKSIHSNTANVFCFRDLSFFCQKFSWYMPLKASTNLLEEAPVLVSEAASWLADSTHVIFCISFCRRWSLRTAVSIFILLSSIIFNVCTV